MRIPCCCTQFLSCVIPVTSSPRATRTCHPQRCELPAHGAAGAITSGAEILLQLSNRYARGRTILNSIRYTELALNLRRNEQITFQLPHHHSFYHTAHIHLTRFLRLTVKLSTVSAQSISTVSTSHFIIRPSYQCHRSPPSMFIPSR